jgi:hypothetical protein
MQNIDFQTACDDYRLKNATDILWEREQDENPTFDNYYLNLNVFWMVPRQKRKVVSFSK